MKFLRTFDPNGVPIAQGSHLNEALESLGYLHAIDRGAQMLLTRLTSRGELCAYLGDDDVLLPVDVFNRQMGWCRDAARQATRLSLENQSLCAAYCAGVNRGLREGLALKRFDANCEKDPWTVQDCIAFSRLVGYFSLAQSQAQIERLLVEFVQAGVNRRLLEELFPGILNDLHENELRAVILTDRNVPVRGFWGQLAPRIPASNNWAVTGAKTASGFAILASDPHLEINRLPSVWYEVILKTAGKTMMGATMPGIPGVWIGRTDKVAWGATYAFMDQVDSWIEHCDAQRVRRGDIWVPLEKRIEMIQRRGRTPVAAPVYTSIHGVLDGEPFTECYRLATNYSGVTEGAGMLSAFLDIWNVASVADGMKCLARVEMGCNWMLADTTGSIGYQMSGAMPKRRKGRSGFCPMLGWDKADDWDGFVEWTEFPRALNPECGYLITANNDLNSYGIAMPINMPMSSYRADRIHELLAGESKLDVPRMIEIQHDVVSLQAQVFMQMIKPLLPDNEQGRILRHWDCSYQLESQGAFLFEQIYGALLHTVFGSAVVGAKTIDLLKSETSTFVDFHQNFDRVMLSERSGWFKGRNREEMYRTAISEALQVAPRPWNDVQEVTLADQFERVGLVDGTQAKSRCISLKGGRATIHQGQIYRSGGAVTTFAPSFQMVVDLAEKGIYTSLCGGVSESKDSPSYDSGVENWVRGSYKRLLSEDSSVSD